MLQHTQASPFPYQLINGTWIVGEMCRCGHPRSSHQDTIGTAGRWGGGRCVGGACSCRWYKWGSDIVGEGPFPDRKGKRSKSAQPKARDLGADPEELIQ
jgi:hypothetical protein